MILQDWAVLTDLYPDFPLWKEGYTASIIESNEFVAFRLKMRAARMAHDAAMKIPVDQHTVNKERAQQLQIQKRYQSVMQKMQQEHDRGVLHQVPVHPEASAFLANTLTDACDSEVSLAAISALEKKFDNLTASLQNIINQMSQKHTTFQPSPPTAPHPATSPLPCPEEMSLVDKFLLAYARSPRVVRYVSGKIPCLLTANLASESGVVSSPVVEGLQGRGSRLEHLLTNLAQPGSRRRLDMDLLQPSPQFRLQLGTSPTATRRSLHVGPSSPAGLTSTLSSPPQSGNGASAQLAAVNSSPTYRLQLGVLAQPVTQTLTPAPTSVAELAAAVMHSFTSSGPTQPLQPPVQASSQAPLSPRVAPLLDTEAGASGDGRNVPLRAPGLTYGRSTQPLASATVTAMLTEQRPMLIASASQYIPDNLLTAPPSTYVLDVRGSSQQREQQHLQPITIHGPVVMPRYIPLQVRIINRYLVAKKLEMYHDVR